MSSQDDNTASTATCEEDILRAPGPGAYRVGAASNPDGVRTGYDVHHLAGPSKVCYPAPLFYEQAAAEHYAAVLEGWEHCGWTLNAPVTDDQATLIRRQRDGV